MVVQNVGGYFCYTVLFPLRAGVFFGKCNESLRLCFSELSWIDTKKFGAFDLMSSASDVRSLRIGFG